VARGLTGPPATQWKGTGGQWSQKKWLSGTPALSTASSSSSVHTRLQRPKTFGVHRWQSGLNIYFHRFTVQDPGRKITSTYCGSCLFVEHKIRARGAASDYWGGGCAPGAIPAHSTSTPAKRKKGVWREGRRGEGRRALTQCPAAT
jgi:hypothetical protein